MNQTKRPRIVYPRAFSFPAHGISEAAIRVALDDPKCDDKRSEKQSPDAAKKKRAMKHTFSRLVAAIGIACGLSIGVAFAQNGGGAGNGQGGAEAGHAGTGDANVGSAPGAAAGGGQAGVATVHDGSNSTKAAESVPGSKRPMHGSRTGTISELIPSMSAVIVRTNEKHEFLYHYGANTTIVDPNGKKIPIDQLRANTPATFTYTDDGGGHLSLDKVELQSAAENNASATP